MLNCKSVEAELKRDLNKEGHRPSGLTTLSLNQRLDFFIFLWVCFLFFVFFPHVVKRSVWPWTVSHFFLLSLDLLLVLHLDTSLIFLSEYVCNMAKVV